MVAATTGLFSGAIGSFVAPWVNWSIEKRKGQRAAQTKLISEAREWATSAQTKDEFWKSSVYAQLKPHLWSSSIKAIEATGITVMIKQRESIEYDVNPFREKLLENLASLEKEWGLI